MARTSQLFQSRRQLARFRVNFFVQSNNPRPAGLWCSIWQFAIIISRIFHIMDRTWRSHEYPWMGSSLQKSSYSRLLDVSCSSVLLQFLLYDCKMIVLFCQMRFLFCFLSSFVSQRLPRTASSLYLPWNQDSLIFMTLIVDHWLGTFIWLKHLEKIFVCLCFNFPHHVYIESIFV